MVLDSGDTAWVMMATAMVFLMIPALALFEAGLLRRKNTVSILMQVFSGLVILSVMWFVIGYSLTFGSDQAGFIGNLDNMFLKGIPFQEPLEQYAPTIPGISFVNFQMMFAVITPLLITGVIAGRMKFSAFVVFIIIWSFVIYYPIAHWIWGGGWLAELGVVDFAGGIVIHTSLGMGALAAALILGRREHFSHKLNIPYNIPLALIGGSMLWLGWFGFNAGSALMSGGLAANTIFVTHIAGSVSAIIWIGLSWRRTGKPSIVAAINGGIAGLAGITPASGFVSAEHAFLIAIAIGFATYYGVVLIKDKLKIDDALDVSSVHGISGIVGALAIGIFASSLINPAGPDGLIFGNFIQLPIQAAGVGVAALLGFGGTAIILKVLDRIMGIRVSHEVEDVGLDISEHGESAFSDEQDQNIKEDDKVKE